MDSLYLFLKLVFGHFIADYPLQGDFLSKAKNHKNPITAVPFYQALVAHSFIQAGFVVAITGSYKLGLCEFVLHGFIDYLKSNNTISFNQDQFFHIFCKLVFVLFII